MDTMGDVYRSLALWDRAEPLLEEALKIREEELGPNDPETAESLLHLAFYRHNRAEYDRAEPLYRRALAIREANAAGPSDPDVARALLQLGWMLADEGLPEAETLLRRVIAMHSGQEGRERELAIAQLALAGFLLDQERPTEVVTLIPSATALLRTQEGLEEVAETLTLFQAGVAAKASRFTLPLAEVSLRRSLELGRTALGPNHPYVAFIHFELAGAGRQTEARRG